MTKISQKITSFQNGMTNDPREENLAYSQLIKNFDAHTYPHKLVPLRTSESGDDSAATSQKQNFCIALRTGTTYSLYALGVKSGATTAEVLYKDLTVGSDNDLGDEVWAATGAAAKYQSSTGTTWFNLFVYYKQTGLIYGALGSSTTVGTKIWAYDPSGSANFDDDVITTDGETPFSFTNIAQGLVHSKDDILYIPYDNKICKFVATGAGAGNRTWTIAALTLPSYLKITSICEYGNYLAIACAPLSGIGNSKVYLWDRDSSLTTLTESIDWGEGTLTILEEIEGRLIGITYVSTASSISFPAKLVFRQYSGGTATVFKQFIADPTSNTISLPAAKQKVNNFLYFLCNIKLNSVSHAGLWKIGRITSDDPFAITMDRGFNNDTAVGNGDLFYNFFLIAECAFISYYDASTTDKYGISKTDNSATFTATSIYESLILNAGDSSLTKKLIGATVMTEYLPADGQVVLKYQKDSDIGTTTWTGIFKNTTNDSISYSAVNADTLLDGTTITNLPEYKEIVFRIESTGNAVITGLEFTSEIISKKLY